MNTTQRVNKYVDAHLHLQDERFSLISDAVMQRAEQGGVIKMLCSATSEKDWGQVLSLAQKYSSVLPSLGIHPWYADRVSSGWEQRLADLCQTTNSAIGEIGLDKLCNVLPKIQERIFCAQLDIAGQMQKTVSIHCLKSWGLLLDILRKQFKKPRIIIHSFSGSIEIMEQLLALGATISFSTQLANPVRKKTKQAFMAVPLNRLLLETDAPDQFCRELCKNPEVAGQLNEPVAICDLYHFAAQLRGIEINSFIQQLWDNSLKVTT